MTYSVFDKSAALGEPYELFKFVGVLRNYYYTNSHQWETFQGDDYEPLQITRGVTEISTSLTSIQTVSFSVPTNCDLFEDHGRALSPPDLTVEVFRLHRNAAGHKRRIVGTVTAHTSQDESYTLEAKSTIQTQLNRKIASVYYQNMCNHELFDERCKVVKADYTVTTTLSAIAGVNVVVIDDQHANGQLVNGRVTIGNETRVIITNTDNTLFLAYPFIGAEPGDGVSITLGCDLARTTCVSVFDNIANYGGFPTIPTDNPALPALDIVNTTTTNTQRQEKATPFWGGISVTSK